MQNSEEYIQDNDPKFDEAVALVIDRKQCSASMIQRHLRVEYDRASRMVERMECDGMVTAPDAFGTCQGACAEYVGNWRDYG